ncbi:hypothetical protein AB0L67_42035 [Streptomyces flaveolus]|uniref:hypothetical protein n=1 Tax=Streptomyces flaveolus TaxID=67297 RepID=UPI0034221448
MTATAKVTLIRWTMGDGATVTCAGPGTPYRGSKEMADSPDCGTATPVPAVAGPASGSR